MFVGGVKVHYGAFAADGRKKLMHSIAVGRLSRAWRSDNQLCKGHVAWLNRNWIEESIVGEEIWEG